MKLTWFGGTTIRIHIGGVIVVIDAEFAPESIDQRELISGADRLVGFAEPSLAQVDGKLWAPRRPRALFDRVGDDPVNVQRLAAGVLLIDAVGEPPLVLAAGALPGLGGWSRDAVVTLLAEDFAGQLEPALAAAPRLIALAGPEPAVASAVDGLRDRLGTTSLLALEPGLALEA